MASPITANEPCLSRFSIERSERTSLWSLYDGEAAFAKIKALQEMDGLRAKRNYAECKSHWRSILSYLDVVASSLCAVTDRVPMAKSAVNSFKVLLRMEQTRHDNCAQIVDQCYSIGRMLDLFKHFTAGLPDLDADMGLRRSIGDIERAIEDFANFSRFYYAECKRPLFRIWNGAYLRKKVDGFNARFEGIASELHTFLAANGMLLLTAQCLDDEKKLSEISSRIRAQFEDPSNEREAEASAFIEKRGRDAILGDQAQLNELANILNEKVTESTRERLWLDIEQLLQSRTESFHRKFQSSIASAGDDIAQYRESVLTRLDAGPHELLSDPDIKEVWKMNNWKLSVKGRHLIDELSNYFEEKFRMAHQSNNPRADAWTLPVLSRAMHHSTIVDAIDEDGSGFIAIHEVEAFSRRRPTVMTLPEWLVYWAVGWKINNLKYNTTILALLDTIGEKCRKAARVNRPEDIRQAVRQYLSHIEALKNVAAWADSTDSGEEDASFGFDGIQLQNLLQLTHDLDTMETHKRWEELQWKVEEPSDMSALFTGSDTCIEQNFLRVTKLLLENHRDRIATAKNLRDGDWSEMAETLGALVQGFGERVRSLAHRWLAQKLDVELQVTSHAGGSCAGWYAMYGQSYRDVKRNVSFVDMSSGSTPTATAFSLPAQTMAGQINELGDRVDKLERLINERMDALQKNMASILREVLISDIMCEAGMLSTSSASVQTHPTSLANHPSRGSKPVINIEIPSVSFNDVVVNQNGSLHMNTPVGTLHDSQRRVSGETFDSNFHGTRPSLARSKSLAMSSFVQTANGRKYVSSYDEGAEESFAYAPSTAEVTGSLHTEVAVSDAISDAWGSGLSDAQSGTGPSGLGTPTSMKFQSPRDQYYGGVLLISRADPTPHLRIAPVDQDVGFESTTSPRFSPASLSTHSDTMMGRYGYDVPVSAIPGTDTDSARSKASKQSASSSTSGFRGGLKSVKESIRGIGSSSNGSKIRKKGGSANALGSPTNNNVSPRLHPGVLGVGVCIGGGTSNGNWYHMHSGASSNGTISPPPTSATERFDMTMRSPNSTSPFSCVKIGANGSQPRLPVPYCQEYSHGYVGLGDGEFTPTERPSISSIRTFGQPAGGIGASPNVGLALAQPPFGRSGNAAGMRSVDVVPPSRGTELWPNVRRSRSIEGLSGGEF